VKPAPPNVADHDGSVRSSVDDDAMSTMKAFRFPVTAHWAGGHLTRISGHDKPDLQVATPPEFRDGIAGVWSPEDLLVGAVVSCYVLTVAAIAEQRNVPLHEFDVSATGLVAPRQDGQLVFAMIDLDVSIETDRGLEGAAEDVARAAEHHCLISASLDVPLHVRVEVSTPAEIGATAGTGA
jgi:organic hydroperoxide reductase OsmC/OhrA